MKKVHIKYGIEEDGRHSAEVIGLPGVWAYGDSREQAVWNAQALALRVIASSVAGGLIEQAWLDELFTVSGPRERGWSDLVTSFPELGRATRYVPDDIWHAFHRAWTKAVGTPEYNKKAWQQAEFSLIKRWSDVCSRCGTPEGPGCCASALTPLPCGHPSRDICAVTQCDGSPR